MKNRFKFRVWDKLLNKFIPWNGFISFDNPEYIVMQHLDAYDFYEGDIIKITDGKFRDHVYYGVVYWDALNAAFMARDSRNKEFGWVGPEQIIDVIGNVFENPDLLASLPPLR